MVHLHIMQGECIALFIQSVIYGIDTAVFTMCVRIMMQKLRYPRAPIRRLFLLIAIILFVLATVDVMFSLCFVAITDTSALPACPEVCDHSGYLAGSTFSGIVRDSSQL
ncbi:uncharacterized protein LAESUDRAFT_723313 [Laetiporus sulphureus 93-53]|uniref:Uncharacterized protein n=1 Tax=Laetiporus sulphureus 93-53 TaxID=1314785 RepID=A0A165FI56_9APHY|nr:uncharacterized protein LAESUDRAFT_723313 [Laetiporus sulphureus 93-53]KZT09006.1 hypothetical protein LAESUDRAFT_723313 [Laetiporus sulphureus 93-53]